MGINNINNQDRFKFENLEDRKGGVRTFGALVGRVLSLFNAAYKEPSGKYLSVSSLRRFIKEHNQELPLEARKLRRFAGKTEIQKCLQSILNSQVKTTESPAGHASKESLQGATSEINPDSSESSTIQNSNPSIFITKEYVDVKKTELKKLLEEKYQIKADKLPLDTKEIISSNNIKEGRTPEEIEELSKAIDEINILHIAQLIHENKINTVCDLLEDEEVLIKENLDLSKLLFDTLINSDPWQLWNVSKILEALKIISPDKAFKGYQKKIAVNAFNRHQKDILDYICASDKNTKREILSEITTVHYNSKKIDLRNSFKEELKTWPKNQPVRIDRISEDFKKNLTILIEWITYCDNYFGLQSETFTPEFISEAFQIDLSDIKRLLAIAKPYKSDFLMDQTLDILKIFSKKPEESGEIECPPEEIFRLIVNPNDPDGNFLEQSQIDLNLQVDAALGAYDNQNIDLMNEIVKLNNPKAAKLKLLSQIAARSLGDSFTKTAQLFSDEIKKWPINGSIELKAVSSDFKTNLEPIYRLLSEIKNIIPETLTSDDLANILNIDSNSMRIFFHNLFPFKLELPLEFILASFETLINSNKNQFSASFTLSPERIWKSLTERERNDKIWSAEDLGVLFFAHPDNIRQYFERYQVSSPYRGADISRTIKDHSVSGEMFRQFNNAPPFRFNISYAFKQHGLA